MSRPSGFTRQRGFTLIEIVVALTISSLLVGFAAYLITMPMNAYVDHAARAQLTTSSENISRQMVDDLQHALPNSVRVSTSGNRVILEMLRVSGMGYFRPQGVLPSQGTLLDTDRGLDFIGPDQRFSTFGSLLPELAIDPYPNAGQELPPGGHLVIGNRGSGTGAENDAYRVSGSGTKVITPVGMRFWLNKDPLTKEETITLSAPFRFTDPSIPTPVNVTRVFWVETPVSYICNTNANARSLRRYSGYPITAALPTSENSAQLSGAQVHVSLLAGNITSCRFACTNPNICAGTIVIDIGVARFAQDGGNEIVRVFEQVALDNDR